MTCILHGVGRPELKTTKVSSACACTGIDRTTRHRTFRRKRRGTWAPQPPTESAVFVFWVAATILARALRPTQRTQRRARPAATLGGFQDAAYVCAVMSLACLCRTSHGCPFGGSLALCYAYNATRTAQVPRRMARRNVPLRLWALRADACRWGVRNIAVKRTAFEISAVVERCELWRSRPTRPAAVALDISGPRATQRLSTSTPTPLSVAVIRRPVCPSLIYGSDLTRRRAPS